MQKPLSLKIGVSGVRGIVGDSLTPQLVTSFAAAFGTHCGPGPVIVGTDSRPSRDLVKNAVIAGLMSVGCTPVDLGIVPVPALQLRVRERSAFGGVCVTASHNPIEWNALKFFGPDGIILRPNQAAQLTDLYHQGTFPRVGAEEIAHVTEDHDAVPRHREACLRLVDVERVRARHFRVAIDCCNGAGSLATPEFLRALGCEVVATGTDPDSPFPHDPEPVPENLGALCALVRESRVDIGFAQDADADRLAIVDEAGRPLGEECTLALAVRHWLGSKPGPVVVNVAASRMVDDVGAEFGCQVHRARVGEVNVLERMLQVGAAIGGEGNGGVIVPAVNPCRDSFVGMALVLEALAEAGGTISELRSHIPTYAIVKEKHEWAARDIAPAVRRFLDAHRADPLDLTDGVKVNWPDRWVQARGSNTEPVLRVTAEAPTEQEARRMTEDALAILRG